MNIFHNLPLVYKVNFRCIELFKLQIGCLAQASTKSSPPPSFRNKYSESQIDGSERIVLTESSWVRIPWYYQYGRKVSFGDDTFLRDAWWKSLFRLTIFLNTRKGPTHLATKGAITFWCNRQSRGYSILDICTNSSRYRSHVKPYFERFCICQQK